MWIVFQAGTPDVYEFETRLQAMLKFNEIIDNKTAKGKIYIAEVDRSHEG